MGYSKGVYQKARKIIDERHSKAEQTALDHQREIYSKFARAEQIRHELASHGIKSARAVLSGQNVTEQLNALKEISLELSAELTSILTQNGYPANYLEPDYICHKCQDKGMYEDIDNNATLLCDCYLKLITQIACEELNKTSPLSLSTFDSFDLNYYSKDAKNDNGISNYTQMSRIYNYCKEYANNFNLDSANLFLTGNTGLGKTHLSLAIANVAILKGYGVIYSSAPTLLNKLEKAHFSYEYSKEDEIVGALCDCDLLIIDDLGTEFASLYSKSALYNIFNNRLLKQKPTVINTNLSFRELQELYSPRFVSRLAGEFIKLDFVGNDIRIALRNKKFYR